MANQLVDSKDKRQIGHFAETTGFHTGDQHEFPSGERLLRERTMSKTRASRHQRAHKTPTEHKMKPIESVASAGRQLYSAARKQLEVATRRGN